MAQGFQRRWTDKEFDSISWHDNALHGIQIGNPRIGDEFDLIFDIDHILKWIECPDGSYSFWIAAAKLVFHRATNIQCKLHFAYKEQISISAIERSIPTDQNRTIGLTSCGWQIQIARDENSAGEIVFEADGFTQELTSEPIRTNNQWLDVDER